MKKKFLLSCIYLTRRCPMNCKYCAIRKTRLERELTLEEWKKAFLILKKLGVEFNLILGNETLLLGNDLVKLVEFLSKENICYALYTTFYPLLYQKLKEKLIKAGIKNVSCGFDSLTRTDSIGIKSRRGLEGMIELKKRIKGLDTQVTITLSKINLDKVTDLLEVLTKNKIWAGFNIIHWDKDGKYDFFPPKEMLSEFVITNKDKFLEVCSQLKKFTQQRTYMIQNPPEYFDALAKYGLELSWHCKELCVFSVDADGSLRLCGYRKGEKVPKFTIFDLTTKSKFQEFERVWKEESKQCPGCFWGYYWQAEHCLETNKEGYGEKVFRYPK